MPILTPTKFTWPGGVTDAIEASGEAISPVAGQVLVAIPTPAGIYRILTVIHLLREIEHAPQNLRIRENGVQVATLPTVSGRSFTTGLLAVSVAGGNIDVQVIADAVGGSDYNVTLAVVQVG